MFFTITRLVNLALNSFKRSNFSSLLQLKGKYIVGFEILHRHHVFALLKYLNESCSFVSGVNENDKKQTRLMGGATSNANMLIAQMCTERNVITEDFELSYLKAKESNFKCLLWLSRRLKVKINCMLKRVSTCQV